MKAEEIREGDIVEIDYITEYTKEHVNEGKALVIWKGFNHQPLIMRLGREEYSPVWACYEHISKVVGHIPIGDILKEQAESEVEEMRVEDAVKWLRKRLADTSSFDGIDRKAIIAVVGDAEQREFNKKEEFSIWEKKK